MSWNEVARVVGPIVLALVSALFTDYLCARRGLLPPGFHIIGRLGSEVVPQAVVRRFLAFLLLALVFYVGVFSPLSLIGTGVEIDLASVRLPQLFLLHATLAAAMMVWFLLGFVGLGQDASSSSVNSWVTQYGLRAPKLAREIGLGLIAGIGAWVLVLLTMIALTILIVGMGGEEMLPAKPPPIIVWIAALPVWLRVAVSLSAGFVEEAFFRGFLQPRVGILWSSVFFALAHLSYDQPIMLLGVALLSLLFAALVQWRQNIWPAIAAHALFDAVQLLVVIPTALKFLDTEGSGRLSTVVAAISKSLG